MTGGRPRALALVAVATAAAVLSAGCVGDPTGSPVQTIPKVIVDFHDNMTKVTLTSLNADVRYDNLSLVIANENLTEPLNLTDTFGWALVAETDLTFFELNASADDGESFYYYNATMHIVEREENGGGQRPQWQIFIRDTPLGSLQTQPVPFTRLLEEGRL